ncbi:SDR family NAD(P)-dependent oxidoreductase, partial [uncultured Fusobacterium sp.]
MNVLITGATGGIGKSLIDIFIKNNYHVIALGRNVDELKKLQNKYG